MKKLRAGLVVEGNSTSSVILRLPSVADELGPIKSGSLQVARRVSNFLRAGYAVTSYRELASARIVLIRVPDSAVARVVEELCASDLPLAGVSFVLCETWVRTEALEPLRERGAFAASVVAASENKGKCFAVEGDLPAVRLIKRMVERGEARMLELRTGSKHMLFAATVLLTSVPVPIMMLAQQALRESGISGSQLAALLEDLASGTLSRHLRGARMAAGTMANCRKEDADAYSAHLKTTHPELASTVKSLMDWASAAADRQELTRGQGAS